MSWWRLAQAVAVASLLTGCGIKVCAPLSAEQLAATPTKLSQTGLYDDVRAGRLRAGVRSYRPQFELWHDGAEERRWIALPDGATIDTNNMDGWRFPIGTKLWKEFVRDGTRVETRLIEKVGADDADWLAMAYVWKADQSDALAAVDGVVDALGTPHDVPAAQDCMACHGGVISRVLGFSAIQLSFDAGPGELDLQALIEENRLSHPPTKPLSIPGNAIERQALGYLHANCGSCHNQQRPPRTGPRCYDPERTLDFRLRTSQLATVEQTPTYRTMGDVIEPGDPDSGKLINTTDSRFPYYGMPYLASEDVDEQGVALLRRWLAQMKQP
jgi:hypothetical protein